MDDGLAKAPKVVIASGALHRMVFRAERSNPTKSLRGQSPRQSQEFLRYAQDKASSLRSSQ
jgi:hypothetical protein